MGDSQTWKSRIDFMKGVDTRFLKEECSEIRGGESFKDSMNKLFIVTFCE